MLPLERKANVTSNPCSRPLLTPYRLSIPCNSSIHPLPPQCKRPLPRLLQQAYQAAPTSLLSQQQPSKSPSLRCVATCASSGAMPIPDGDVPAEAADVRLQHTHTHAHTHTHTYTHTHTLTHTRSRTHIHTSAHTHTRAHTLHVFTHIFSHMLRHPHPHSHIHTYLHVHTHSHTHIDCTNHMYNRREQALLHQS